MILRIILKSAVNALAIFVAAHVFSGVNLNIEETSTAEGVAILLGIGFVVWIGNTLIRPLVKVLTFPLIVVTFGLFNIVINVFILWGADIILPQLEIIGFWPLLWTTIFVSVANSLLFFI